jgi:hypothetical protein
MVKDEHIRTVRAAVGSKGGNPALTGIRSTAVDQGILVNQSAPLVNQRFKQNRTPASAVASALATASATKRAEAEESLASAVELPRDRVERAAAAPPAPLKDLSSEAREAAESILATFYATGASEARRSDVAQTMADTLSERGAYLRRGLARVRARDVTHFVAKCRELLEERENIRNPNCAIVCLLEKLNDPISEDVQSDCKAIAATIRELRQRRHLPNGAPSWFIDQKAVAALGADVFEAYSEVGGADAFIETPSEKWPFLVRRFIGALTRVRNVNGAWSLRAVDGSTNVRAE